MKFTYEVNGMMCHMCEKHVEDAVKEAFDVKSVKADNKKNTCVIDAEKEPDAAKLEEVIKAAGYTFAGAR